MKLDDYKNALELHAKAVSHYNLVQKRSEEIARYLDEADEAVHRAEGEVHRELIRLNEVFVLNLVELPRPGEAELTQKMKRQYANAWKLLVVTGVATVEVDTRDITE